MSNGMIKKVIIISVILVLVLLFKFFGLGEYLTLDFLKQKQDDLLTMYEARPVLILSLYCATYIVVTALSLPGAAVMGGGIWLGIWGLSVAAAVSAIVCIRGKYQGSQLRVFVFKPLTTVLLLTLALAGGASQTSYGSLVVIAMVLSLFGDIFLMLPKDRFLYGLLSFLAAHVVLILAFTLDWYGVIFTACTQPWRPTSAE